MGLGTRRSAARRHPGADRRLCAERSVAAWLRRGLWRGAATRPRTHGAPAWFRAAQPNVLAAANGRGKGEAAVVQALALIMLDLSKFAQDVLLFTTSEFGFMSAPHELCDGSSMMPQKHNLSALELVRARAQTVIALQGQMLATLAGLPSGYNMDYQETKAPLIEALHLCRESLAVVALFAQHLTVDDERARAACTSELFATDRAYALVRAGVPFRDAYRQAATAVDDAPPERPGCPAARTHRDRHARQPRPGQPHHAHRCRASTLDGIAKRTSAASLVALVAASRYGSPRPYPCCCASRRTNRGRWDTT